jgi:hypothetical protein
MSQLLTCQVLDYLHEQLPILIHFSSFTAKKHNAYSENILPFYKTNNTCVKNCLIIFIDI